MQNKKFLIKLSTLWLLCCLAATTTASVKAEENTQPAIGNSANSPVTTENQQIDSPSNNNSAWNNFIPPPDDKFDWIQLTSGEWLKGELNALYNYSLEFDSDELDLLKLDWDDVKQIRTAGPKSIRIEDSDSEPITVIGVLTMTESKFLITSGDDVQEFDREQVVSIAEGAQREIDLWTGKISLGANIRGGNSDLTDSSLLANTRRRTAVSRFVVDYVGNYSKAEGIETSNNHRLNSYYDAFISSKFFWRTIAAEYFRDIFKNIEHQVSVGTAFGYDFIRTSKTEWEVSGGVGAVYKKFVSVEEGSAIDNTSPSLGVGTKYDTEFTSWMDYLLDFSFQIVDKDSGRYTHHFLTTLSTDLLSDLDLDISFVWDHVQDPQPTADGLVPQRDDYQLILGVAYEF